jgi:Mg2+/Co2+ transporter CorB
VLPQAKAFDKKTSVLHYLVKLLKQNDELLVGFHNDLQHIADAENTILDSLVTEIRVLKDELVQVHATAKLEADRLEEVGQLTQISLKDLMEQRTAVRNIESIPQFNKMDHLTGRTPMERFALGAGITIDQAIEHVDSVKDMYGKLLEYFGEDGKMPSNEFFGTMRRFVTEFGTAVEQVEKAEKAKVRIECHFSFSLPMHFAKLTNCFQ